MPVDPGGGAGGRVVPKLPEDPKKPKKWLPKTPTAETFKAWLPMIATGAQSGKAAPPLSPLRPVGGGGQRGFGERPVKTEQVEHPVEHQPWLPADLRAFEAPGFEDTKLQASVRKDLYDLIDLSDMVWEQLGGQPVQSLTVGARSWVDKLIAEPVKTIWKASGQAIHKAVWQWGAELMYQLPKIPERLWYANAKTGAWVHLGGMHGAGGSPYENALRMSLTGDAPEMILEAAGQYRNITQEEILTHLKEGEIGYSLAVDPSRLEQFRKDIADPDMTMKQAVANNEMPWLEFGLNLFIDPAWIIPAGLMKYLWPGGAALGKVVGAIGGELSASAARKKVTRTAMGEVGEAGGKLLTQLGNTKPIAWLRRMTNYSLIAQTKAQGADAAMEVVLRRGESENALTVLDRALLGELPDSSVLGRSSRDTLESISAELQEGGISSLDDLFSKYLPDRFGAAWADGALQPLLKKDPTLLAYLTGESLAGFKSHTLQVPGAKSKGALNRSITFAKHLLKEQWLSLNPAYHLGNTTDNTVKCWSLGHYINPFDYSAPTKLSQYMGEFGVGLPTMVGETFMEETPGVIRNIPIPGIGKPTEIMDFWGLKGKWPTLDALVPDQPSRVLLDLKLAEPPSRSARFLDKANYASLSEWGRNLGGKVEGTARAQLFWSVFSQEMEDVARPALLAAARGMGFSDDLLKPLSKVKSPDGVLALADLLVGDTVPAIRLSNLLPEGAGSLLDDVAKTLDTMQANAITKGTPEALDDLARYADDLLDAVAGRAQDTIDAGAVEEVITKWEAQRIRNGIGDLLGRSREVVDGLLLDTQTKAAQNPKAAGSYWARYFDKKGAISEGVQVEVSRMVRQRTPELSFKVDDLLQRAVTPDSLVQDLSKMEWGEFGEHLAMLRGNVDEAQELMWKAFLAGDMSTERLTLVEEAQDAVRNIWLVTSGEVSIWRDGYLAQMKGVTGKPRISTERYEQVMTEMWDTGFESATAQWNKVRDSLAGDVFDEYTARVPALVDNAAQLDAFRRSQGMTPGLSEEFIQRQQDDPQAALKWFLEQKEEIKLRLQEEAQAEYVEDLGRNYSDKMSTEGQKVLEQIKEWRLAIAASIQDGTKTRTVSDQERKAAEQGLQTLTEQWTKSIDDAKLLGEVEVGRILFNYSRTQNWEQALTNVFPFTKWQLRNPFVWARILTQQPALFGVLTRYVRASENYREQKDLSTRFKGTMPVPFQEQLQEAGMLPEGYLAMDPRFLMSGSTQLKSPFVSPDEAEAREGMEPWQRWISKAVQAPEYLGLHLLPWLQQGLAAAGVSDPPSWGVSGAFGRVFPQVREAEEAAQEVLLPGGAPSSGRITGYWEDQVLAAWVAEGKISAEEAAAPTPELLERAKAAVRGESSALSTARWLQPMGFKHARAGEMQIRQLKGEMADMPEERAAYLRSLHPELAAYSRAIGGISEPETAEWKAQRDAINLKYDGLAEGVSPWHPRYAEIQQERQEELEGLGESPGEPYISDEPLATLERERPRPDDFMVGEEINWDAYNAAEEKYSIDVSYAGVTPEEYEKYRRRYLSPLELAWKFQQERAAVGWDEYQRLRDRDNPPPELSEWVDAEATRRVQEGWSAQEATLWANEQTQLPYEVVQQILEEQYGARTIEEIIPEIVAERPWLKEGQRPEVAEGFTVRPYWLRNIDTVIDQIEYSRTTHESLAYGEEHDVKVMGYYDEILDVLQDLEKGQAVPPQQIQRALDLIQENISADIHLARDTEVEDSAAFRGAIGGYTEVQDLLEQALSPDKLTTMVRSSEEMRDQGYAEEWLAQQGHQTPPGMTPMEYADQLQGVERPISEEWSEEWGGLGDNLRLEVPGMFTARSVEQQMEQEITTWFFDLMPEQRRQVNAELQIEEGVEFQDWVKTVPEMSAEMALQIYTIAQPPSADTRLQIELDMVRFQAGTGDWTPLLEQYYSNPNAPKSRFWSTLHEVILNDDAYKDPVLAAILSEDVRGQLQFSDEQYEQALEYLNSNMGTLIDPEAMALAQAHPEWFELAREQASEVRALVAPEAIQDMYMSLDLIGERKDWQQAHPEEWAELTEHWGERTRLQLANPYYLYFYKHDQYFAWFKHVPPNELNLVAIQENYAQADRDMDAFEGGGEWTDKMTHWFGGGVKSEFWEFYFANKGTFASAMWKDDLVMAAIERGARPYLTKEGEELLYKDAFEAMRQYAGMKSAEEDGESSSAKSAFWEFYFDNKGTFAKEMWKDDLVMAALRGGVGYYLTTAGGGLLYQDALEAMRQYAGKRVVVEGEEEEDQVDERAVEPPPPPPPPPLPGW